MARIRRYIRTPTPAAGDLRTFVNSELQKIQTAMDTLATLLTISDSVGNSVGSIGTPKAINPSDTDDVDAAIYANGLIRFYPNGGNTVEGWFQQSNVANGGLNLGTRANPLPGNAFPASHAFRSVVDGVGVPGLITQHFFAINTNPLGVTSGIELGNDTSGHELFMGVTGTLFSGTFMANGPAGEIAYITVANNKPLVIGTFGNAQLVLDSTGIHGYGSAANAQIDLNPDFGTFVGVFTGCSTAVNITLNWRKIGNFVRIWNAGAAVVGVSTLNTFTITGLPAVLQPTDTQQCPTSSFQDNSVGAILGGVSVSGSVIFCQKLNLTTGALSTTGWTVGNNKGVGTGFSMTYST